MKGFDRHLLAGENAPIGKLTRIKDTLPSPRKLIVPVKLKDIQLTREEQAIEDALIKGEYVSVSKAEFDRIVRAIAYRKKDAVLNIRINKYDLQSLKQKAKKHGIKYQTFISEVLHRVAHS